MTYDPNRSFGSYCFVEDSVVAGGQPLDSPVGEAIAYEKLRRFGGLPEDRIRAAVEIMTSPNWSAGLPVPAMGAVAVGGAKPTGLI